MPDRLLGHLAAFFNTEVVGFLECDAEARIVRANRGLLKLLGCDEDELRGRAFVELVDASGRDRLAAALEGLEHGPERVVQLELSLTSHTGAAMPVLVSIQAGDRGADGRLQWYGVFVVNRADLYDMQQSLGRALDKHGALYAQTVEALSRAIEAKDPYTAGHQIETAKLAVRIGQRLALAAERLQGVYLGGVVHDIGKIGVPVEYLTKSTRLTALEFDVIKTHTELGYRVLKEIDTPWPLADMAHQHHERLDGTGYPQRLANGAIILEARILAVADTVDSMMKPRPYRAAQGLDRTLRTLRQERGHRLDADVVDACLAELAA